MPSDRPLLEREMQRVELPPFTLDDFHRRRNRKERNRRIGSALVALLVAGVTLAALLRAFSSGTIPADDPRGPFLGTWVSTSDTDGGTQTMTVRVSADGAVEITVRDNVASVCSGTPSTMTGTGRIEGGTQLVIPAPVYTCDDGSEPQALSGPPLEEQLRDWTLFLDPQTDTLSDGFGGLWLREGAEVPSPEPTISGGMWPQTSLEEVRQAQELADAGDPAYTWQVDEGLASGGTNAGGSRIIVRFLQEGLGWEAFRGGVGGNGGEFAEGIPGSGLFGTYEGVFIRCAAGRTNPLYPDDPEGRGCAPTIDEFRYETVKLQVAQLGGQGLSGIWVVARWEMLPPSDQPMTRGEESFSQRQIEQVAPITDAEATALLQAFLQARIDGEGAQELLSYPVDGEIPLLYATTNGSPYQRYEIELLKGPVWPLGGREFKVRMFAEGGETVVEQFFAVAGDDTGRPMVEFSAPPESSQAGTTENGQVVPVPYSVLDGEVTFGVAHPWDTYSGFDLGGGPNELILTVENNLDERVVLAADPRPVEAGCQPGPVPADAEALARSLRSDPDLEATAPVAVSLGGTPALRMDVVVVTGASVCDAWPAPRVLSANDRGWPGMDLGHGSRMRLYLLDLPGGSARILAIAIVAPESRFEQVVEAASPIVDSFEFHAR